MRPSLILGAFSIVLTLMPVVAEECVPTTSEPELAAGGFYVDNDLCQPECLFSIWIYQESNDIDGLQRGDEVKDDTCGGMIASDTLPCAILPAALLTPRRKGDGRDARAPVVMAAALTATGIVALAPTAEAC